MKLIRFNPLSQSQELGRLHHEFGRLFDHVLAPESGWNHLAPLFAPAADIHETADEFVVKMDLPGLSLADIKVNLTGENLSIRGERKTETQVEGTRRHLVERIHGAFERTFVLSSAVRADQVKAKYRDGVLEVRVPKADQAREREIQIQTD